MSKLTHVLTSTALAFACAAALQAQAPASKPSSPAALTVTGCVERADQVPGNSTAATTVDSLSFVLMHAVKRTAADQRTRPSGTSGTSDTKPVAKGSMYRLDGDVSTLNPHVGHRVEITGALLTSPATGDTAEVSASNAPTMKVDRVKMLSETCNR